MSSEQYNNLSENILTQTSQLDIISQQKRAIDLDAFPPDLELAKNYGLSKRIMRPKTDIDFNKICPISQQSYDKQQISFCERTDSIDYYGMGIPLYFDFKKFATFLLFLIVLFMGIKPLIDNVNTNDCQVLLSKTQKITCYFNKYSQYSVVNKGLSPDKMSTQSILNLSCVLATIICLQFYRYHVRSKVEEFDRGNISPSDFSIQIDNLPRRVIQKKELENILQNWWVNNPYYDQRKLQVRKVVLAYDIRNYIEQMNIKKKFVLEKKKYELYKKKKGTYPSGMSIQEIEQNIQKAEDTLNSYEEQVRNGKQQNVTVGAFVTFTFENEQTKVMETQQSGFMRHMFNKLKVCMGFQPTDVVVMDGNILKIQRAIEPSDVIWENFGYKTSEKMCKRIITTIASVLVLVVCFLITFGLSYSQKSILQKQRENKKQGYVIPESQLVGLRTLAIVSSLVVVFINTLLIKAIQYFSQLEKHQSKTHQNISISEKLLRMQFVNTALITIGVNYIVLGKDNLFDEGGIINDTWFILLSNAIVPPIMLLLNPFYFLRLYKRSQIEKQLIADKESLIMTQQEANLWFEGTPLDFSFKYAGLIKTLWVLAFYSAMHPLMLSVTFGALILSYLVEKYILVYQNSQPDQLGSDLNSEMIEELEYIPLLMSIGNLYFNNLILPGDNQKAYLDYIAIAISAINFLLPMEKINKMIFKVEQLESYSGNYDQYISQFITEYDRTNPITKDDALQEYLLWKEVQANPELKQKYDEMIQKNLNSDNQGQNFFGNLQNYAQYHDQSNNQYQTNFYQRRLSIKNFSNQSGFTQQFNQTQNMSVQYNNNMYYPNNMPIQNFGEQQQQYPQMVNQNMSYGIQMNYPQQNQQQQFQYQQQQYQYQNNGDFYPNNNFQQI